MDKGSVHTSIEDLPEEIIYSCIFKYLSPIDIFNLGQCSRRLRNIVVYNSTHPLGTRLQHLKTKYKHFMKTPTVYDNMPCFNLMSKCSKKDCPCFNYHQRKDWIIMDPAFCPSCDETMFNGEPDVDRLYSVKSNDDIFRFGPCTYHCVLMKEILDLNLCEDCRLMQKLCFSCSKQLDC